MKGSVDIERLQSNIAWALEHGLKARDLIPMYEKLLAHAPRGSHTRTVAALQLSELLVETAPWRALVLGRQVVREVSDERAWAVMALAHTLLGNHRSARRAYRQALAIAPGCASYAHNLGHLMDVVFNEPGESLTLLASAHRALPGEKEIAASYAHALVRAGHRKDARRVLSRALGTSKGVDEMLDSWLAQCPPPGSTSSTSTITPDQKRVSVI